MGPGSHDGVASVTNPVVATIAAAGPISRFNALPDPPAPLDGGGDALRQARAEFLEGQIVELRKELVEAQKLRAQIIGFKITFVGAAIGLIGANFGRIPSQLIAMPALAAIFFDLLITSKSFSIKRNGLYIRKYLEPLLKAHYDLPPSFPMWEEFMNTDEAGQNLSFWGHLGITILVAVPALVVLASDVRLLPSIPLLVTLIGFLLLDVWHFLQPRRLCRRR